MKTLLIALLVFFIASFDCFSQGQLWGLTTLGGSNDIGTIYKIKDDGSPISIQKSFTGYSDGAYPFGELLKATNGLYYGVTSAGGDYNLGTIFSYNPTTSKYAKIYQFTQRVNGYYPVGKLVQASNGKLYGMTTYGGVNGRGVIFEYDLTLGYKKRFDFLNQLTGANPFGSLLKSASGKLFGMTDFGGANSAGTIFEFDPTTSVFIKKFDFLKPPNIRYYTNLVEAPNGMIYGLKFVGGAFDRGFLFELNPTTGLVSVKVDFGNSVGVSYPEGNLVVSPSGILYGVSTHLYQFDTSTGVFSIIQSYIGYGANRVSLLSNSKLYVIHELGGASNSGFIYEYDINTSVSRKFDLDITRKYELSKGGLVEGINGNYLGLSASGGNRNAGILYEFNPTSWILNKKYEFAAIENGVNPYGGLIKHSNGKFYGLTSFGGVRNTGTLIEYDPVSKSLIKKGDFNDIKGENSYGSLTDGGNGKLYGMTYYGDNSVSGSVIFEYDPSTNTMVKKVDLSSIGYQPMGNLTLASDGKLYGMTQYGLNTSKGALFQYDPQTNSISRKIDFDGGSNGSYPLGSLLQAKNGLLYGTTTYGGANGVGVLFEYDTKTAKLLKKQDFISNTMGSYPVGKLAESTNGKLYGVTNSGGTNNHGVIFEFDLNSGFINKLFDFNRPITGSFPRNGLTSLPNGKLYGQLPSGGSNDQGTLFEFDPNTKTFTKRVDFDLINGSNPNGELMFLPESQNISWEQLPIKTYGDAAFSLNASSSSGLAISYSSSNPSIATINGNVVTILNAGIITITASQSGSESYEPAVNVERTLVINKSPQSISFPIITDKKFDEKEFSVLAETTSGLPIQFAINPNGRISISNGKATIIEAGRVTITANQPGDENYILAASVERSLCIFPSSPQIALDNSNPATPRLTSSQNNGNQWYLDGIKIIGATEKTFLPTKSGLYRLQVSVDDCPSEFSIDYNFVITGDIPSNDGSKIEVFPLPISDEFVVRLGSSLIGHRLSVFQLDGKLIYSDSQTSDEIQINLAGYPAGVYFLKIADSMGFERHFKLIKQ